MRLNTYSNADGTAGVGHLIACDVIVLWKPIGSCGDKWSIPPAVELTGMLTGGRPPVRIADTETICDEDMALRLCKALSFAVC